MQWFTDAVLGGIVYDVLKYVVGPLIVSALATSVLRLAFHKLTQFRELIVFGVGAFLMCVIVFFFIGTRPQQPTFEGAIQQAFSGPPLGSDRDVIAVIGLNIINTGAMQSIVKNWKVKAKIGDTTYDAALVQMPATFTFNNIPRTTLNQPTSVTFHSEDLIVDRTIRPIEIGGMATGILFVEFQNVDANMFRGAVTFEVSYQDVLSREYTISLKGNGQMGTVSAMAGSHTEMACLLPPGSLPKIQTNPLATPKPN
ncbi:MAG: hypothetical protein WBD95_16875 [Xanthobacteraceae bacterium]